MNLDINGLSCVRCKSYLFSEDDVVYCPVCGAPHHRECYNALGHCALEELHGTQEEYSREKVLKALEETENKTEETECTNETKCEMCGESYDSNLERCPKCNAPDINKMSGFQAFDFLGGVPADFDLGEGVTANDAKMFVAANTHRYIPKFAEFKKKNKKISWNWMSFLFPTGWFLSRKMYKGGIVSGLLTVASTLLAYPMSLELYNMGFMGNSYTAEMMNQLAQRIPEISTGAIALAFAGAILEMGIRFVSAIWGDIFYRNYTVNTVKTLKAESENIIEDYRKKGGMSLILFLLGMMLVQYVPLFFTMFF